MFLNISIKMRCSRKIDGDSLPGLLGFTDAGLQAGSGKTFLTEALGEFAMNRRINLLIVIVSVLALWGIFALHLPAQ